MSEEIDSGLEDLNAPEELEQVVRMCDLVTRLLTNRVIQLQRTQSFARAEFEDIYLQLEVVIECVGYPNTVLIPLENFESEDTFATSKMLLLEYLAELQRQMAVAKEKATEKLALLT